MLQCRDFELLEVLGGLSDSYFIDFSDVHSTVFQVLLPRVPQNQVVFRQLELSQVRDSCTTVLQQVGSFVHHFERLLHLGVSE